MAKHSTKMATKMAILLVLCAVVDVLHIEEDELIKLVKTVDRYSEYVDNAKTIRMRDFAESIYNSTGVDFRSW